MHAWITITVNPTYLERSRAGNKRMPPFSDSTHRNKNKSVYYSLAMSSFASSTLDTMSSTEWNELQAYLDQRITSVDLQSIRLEDVDDSSLQCLLQCLRGHGTFDKIGDLFHSSNVLMLTDIKDSILDNNMMMYSNHEPINVSKDLNVKPSSESQSLYDQIYASRFRRENELSSNVHTKSTATTTAFTSSSMADSNSTSTPLDEWQMQILAKLEQQQAAILQCQAQMDALAQLMTALLDASHAKRDPKKDDEFLHFNSKNSQTHPWTKGNTNPSSSPTPPMQKRMIVSLLETLISCFISIPRTITTFLSSLRIVRFLKLLQREAIRQNIQVLHFTLLMKIVFACFIFQTRMNAFDPTTTTTSRDGFLLSFWKLFRIHIFVMVSVVIYFIKTGIASFWYRVFVKDDLLGRVWRDEDINTHPPSMTSSIHTQDTNQERRIDPGIRRGQRDRHAAAAEDDDNDVPRRNGIIRDGRIGGGREHTADANHPIPLAQQRRNNLRNNGETIPNHMLNWRIFSLEQLRQGFLGGNIRRRNQHAGQQQQQQENARRRAILHIYKEVLADCVYFIGSFFLSLFPMWQPRAQPETDDPIGEDGE